MATSDEAGNAYLSIDLHRGNRGFGFSIRGGQEFNNMPLFVLRIADDGAAKADGRLSVGDQIIEINGVTTHLMTHAQAIDIIKHGGQTVRLLVKRYSALRAPHNSGSSSSSLPAATANNQVNGFLPSQHPTNANYGPPASAQGMGYQPRSVYGGGGNQTGHPSNTGTYNNHNNPHLRYGGEKVDPTRNNYNVGGGGGNSGPGGIPSFG